MQLKDTDVAFKDFRKKLIPFLNQFCVIHNIPRPENKYFTIDKHTTVSLIYCMINEKCENLLFRSLNFDISTFIMSLV